MGKIDVTRHKMAEIFRENCNITHYDYADSLRIQEARKCLLNSSYFVLDIALHTGFSNLSAFNSFFYKHTQMSPSEYRQAHYLHANYGNQLYYTYETILGNVTIVTDGDAVTAVQFENAKSLSGKKAKNALTEEAANQLREYLCGKRRQFDLPLRPAGTVFQKTVWQGLMFIPYGETQSYKQMAQLIGKPTANRAVGRANNKNPILIIIPCHRVVALNGALVGYAAGLEIKKRLLEIEKNSNERGHAK